MTAYKLAMFEAATGPAAGLVLGEAIHEVAKLPDLAAYRTTLDLLTHWDEAEPRLQKAAEQLGGSHAAGLPLTQAKLLAPVLYPSAIYCAGANYSDHVQEMARAKGREAGPDPKSLGLKPWHFIKSSRSVIGPGATIALPRHSKKVDWEIELAAVVGRTAKDVPLARALDYVAGYTIANDLSARDLSIRDAIPPGSGFRHDWIGQKCFDGACPLGPWIVPAAQIADPHKLAMKLTVNDVVKQDSTTAGMIYDLAEQLSHLSSCITLYPGDLILTGTPAGVGNGRGEYLAAGDVVTLWIEGIGTLSHRMA
ncbi:MAG TPA: fumarylacetoacetate hydrolase family protein [Stellaceae bacterium]|nr:fumarylacetoacetate hydrolase family protein [Stellaceae bacterium]